MTRWNGNVIENPEAYQAAIQRRIQENARVSRRRKLLDAIEADGPAFKAWLFDLTPTELDALSAAADKLWNDGWGENEPAYLEADRAFQAATKKYWATMKPVPGFIRESLRNWGGLTEGQLDFARKNFAELTTGRAEKEAREAERRANATPWTAGRQIVTGEIASVKTTANDFGVSYKALLTVDGGRKLWTTVPRFVLDTLGTQREDGTHKQFADLKGETLTINVTVELSRDDDPTFAFGSRPTAPPAPKAKKAKVAA